MSGPEQEREQSRSVVGLGEVLWDVVDGSRRPGGAPANVAFHCGQLGCRSVICSRVGRDALGDELVQYLSERSLDTTCVQRDDEHPTGTVTVDASVGHDPRYTIHTGVAWDHLVCDHDWRAILSGASAVCFGTLAQRSEASRRAITQALDAADEALRVYDVNLRTPWYDRETIETSLARASVVKVNGDEARELALMLNWGAIEPLDFARTVMDRFNARYVVITRGAEGCIVVSGSQMVEARSEPIEFVDAVGAGDAFTAGLIRGLLSEAPLESVARFANRVGGLVASRPGAMPRLDREFDALVAELLA